MTASASLTLPALSGYQPKGASSFTEVRCPDCKRRLMAIPGEVITQARMVKSDADRSGRGRVIHCKRCNSLVEVIEHNG